MVQAFRHSIWSRGHRRSQNPFHIVDGGHQAMNLRLRIAVNWSGSRVPTNYRIGLAGPSLTRLGSIWKWTRSDRHPETHEDGRLGGLNGNSSLDGSFQCPPTCTLLKLKSQPETNGHNVEVRDTRPIFFVFNLFSVEIRALKGIRYIFASSHRKTRCKAWDYWTMCPEYSQKRRYSQVNIVVIGTPNVYCKYKPW